MKNHLIEKFSNKNTLIYLCFLVFTAFVWFALQFSKKYTKEIQFAIEYTKVEANQFILPNSDNVVTLMLEGNGFQLLKYLFLPKKIKLDVRQAAYKSSEKAYFTTPKMLGLFKESLGYTGKVAFSDRDTLKVFYSEIIKKKIPVKINSEISLESGFIVVNGVQAYENLITVEGPKAILDTLQMIPSQVLSLKKINRSFEGELNLDLEKIPEVVTVFNRKIGVKVEVDKLTEKEFKIPIEVVNNISNKRVQLFPREVSVIFGVALRDYPSLDKNDFKAVVDMQKASSQSNKLSVKLSKKPTAAQNIRISEKEVQFIIIQ